jgi:uncharacterized membrane protein
MGCDDIMNQLSKYAFLFWFGGMIYFLIELLWRGHSHWTMIAMGGICFIACGLLNEGYTWGTALISQMLISAITITLLELISGLIINIWLGWGVWDYSRMPYNFLGQICLLYTNLWFLLSLVAIILDDYIRYWLLSEEKPKYKVL